MVVAEAFFQIMAWTTQLILWGSSSWISSQHLSDHVLRLRMSMSQSCSYHINLTLMLCIYHWCHSDRPMSIQYWFLIHSQRYYFIRPYLAWNAPDRNNTLLSNCFHPLNPQRFFKFLPLQLDFLLGNEIFPFEAFKLNWLLAFELPVIVKELARIQKHLFIFWDLPFVHKVAFRPNDLFR